MHPNHDFMNNFHDVFLETAKVKKLIVFGCGNEARIAMERFVMDLDVDYFIDNDPCKWYTKFEGRFDILPVLSLKGEDMEKTVVLIARQGIFMAQEQLIDLGVRYYFASPIFIDRNINQGDFLLVM